MSEKSCQGAPTNTSCLLPSLTLFESSTEKSAEIREHWWVATDGVFIYFKRFCAGESHMRCISYFQRRFGGNSCCAVSFQNPSGRNKQYDGGQTAWIADPRQYRPKSTVQRLNIKWNVPSNAPALWPLVLNQVSCSTTVIKIFPGCVFPSKWSQSTFRKLMESWGFRAESECMTLLPGKHNRQALRWPRRLWHWFPPFLSRRWLAL